MLKKRNHFHIIQKDSHAKNGFTLIELLVSISIVGVLSSLIMVNSGFGSRQKNLDRAAQQLALDIRTAQNLSLAPNDSPNCLYGLHVDSATQYGIYKKPNCPITGGSLDHQFNILTDSIISPVSIKNNIVISTPSPSSLDVSFEAPEPITYLQGIQNNSNVQGGGNTVMTITLQSQDNMTKNVVINRFGQVEIQ